MNRWDRFMKYTLDILLLLSLASVTFVILSLALWLIKFA